MSELSEGTYVILSVGSEKAIDVRGANDRSGTNVQQWIFTESDAQIWAFTKPEEDVDDKWQIICSLTGKSLDVALGLIQSGQNIQQWQDNNSNAQRWAVEPYIIDDIHQTYTYNNIDRPIYFIKPYSDRNLAADIQDASSAPGANIWLYESNQTVTQQWIMIPVSCITASGTYVIKLAADPSMCLDVAAGSTANGANVQVYAVNDTDAQVFRADVNPQDFTMQLVNARSHKVLGINESATAKNNTNVQQFTIKTNPFSPKQTWLPIQKGSVTIDGNAYPTYILRLQDGNNMVLDCQSGGRKAKTNIQIYGRNNTIAQQFVFYKTDRYVDTFNKPGAIINNVFTIDAPGIATASNLQFDSTNSIFQARYMLKRYTKGHTTTDKDVWKNINDDSTSNSGWGDAWTSTFVSKPVNGVVTIPNFSPSVTLDTTYQSAEITLEVRVFNNNYDTRFTAHGPVMSSTIILAQKPVISMKSMRLTADSNGENLAITVVLSDNLDNGCERIRSRLVGEDGIAISRWIAGSSMTIPFTIDDHMLRLPFDNEKITIEYTMLTPTGITLESSLSTVFSYGDSSELSMNPVLTYLTDDSYCVTVENPRHAVDCCLIEEYDEEGIHLRNGKPIKASSNSYKKWKFAPTLNRDLQIICLAKQSTNADAPWSISILKCYVKSRAFIWHWQSDPKAESFDTCALVYLNIDNPPAQTRGYTTTAQFYSPVGRTFPVAFSSKNLDLDLSLDAIVLDSDADYRTSMRILNYSTWEYIRLLSKLAGKGIHPCYRSPYGDIHHVAVESVSGTKDAIGYTRVQIKQRVVEA